MLGSGKEWNGFGMEWNGFGKVKKNVFWILFQDEENNDFFCSIIFKAT